MPRLLTKIADGARVHTGHRLLRRAVRHATDPATPDILDGTLSVFECQGGHAIGLSHEVRASMRSLIYKTKVVLATSGLLACSCSCRCGAECKEPHDPSLTENAPDQQRILDVHPLALAYELAQSDKKFSQIETLHSACVAVIRSGNERAVQRAKMSWLVKRGCMNQLWPLDLLDDLWLAWGFQANFMYASMH